MLLPPLLRAARRLAAARPEARSFAARAWLWAPVVRASLAAAGLQSTLRWVEAAPIRRPPTRAANAGGTPAPLVGVAEGRALVQAAFRAHLMGGECLDQSTVQYLLHRRDGLAVRLVVGVKRDPEIAAHAWVEDAPRGVGPDDPSFAPLFASGAEGRGA